MHELAICQALISQVASVARDRKASAVTDIYPLMQNAFPIAAAGTVASAAELHLEQSPLRVRCNECGAESDATMTRLVCRECGDWRTTLVSGDELILRRVVMGEAHV